MKSIRIWKRVERVKYKRVEEARDALEAAQLALDRAEDTAATARTAVLRCEEQADSEYSNLCALYDGSETFAPNLAIQRRHRLELARDKLADAKHELERAERRAEEMRSDMLVARSHLDRCQRQVEMVVEKVADLVARATQAADDLQDEESEEAATARLIAASRSQ